MNLERRIDRLEERAGKQGQPLEMTVRHTVAETGETTLRRYVDGKLVDERVLSKQEYEGT